MKESPIEILRVLSSTIVHDEDIKKFEENLRNAVKGRPSLCLAVDFSNTFHLGSRAIGLLVSLANELRKNQGRMVLFGIQPAIKRVIEVTQIHTVIPVVKDEAEARKTLSARP